MVGVPKSQEYHVMGGKAEEIKSSKNTITGWELVKTK